MQKQDEVYEKLSEVFDPELDQPVTDMGFIEGVEVDEPSVTVHFQLPTYWCSPNFAFIMAEDIRIRVKEIDWVKDVFINLKDHCASEEINQGVSSGKSFNETFSGMSNGELEELRHIFRVKAFKSRQERVLRHLLNLGLDHTMILNMTVQELKDLPGLKAESSLIERYLTIRSEFGQSTESGDLAFVQVDGRRINPDDFKTYMLEARRTRMSMEFNSICCRGLLKTRYGLEEEENEREGIK